jgi:YVTN family beta-propeller protein
MFNPDTAPVSSFMPSFETAARSHKVEPIIAHVHSDVEIETAIVALGRERNGSKGAVGGHSLTYFHFTITTFTGRRAARSQRASKPSLSIEDIMKRIGISSYPRHIKKLALALTLACLLAPASTRAQNAYITNQFVNTVSVIDTTTDTVIATIPVGLNPVGVAVNTDGSKVYITSFNANTVSVIDTVANTVIATIPVGLGPFGVAVSPDGSKVYITNQNSNTVSVIDTATNIVSEQEHAV